jgi:DNA-binding Lrp family transcriptional regulator
MVMIEEKSNWRLISNHGLVLICLENYEGYPMRVIGQVIGITERAVQRIIADLEKEAYIKREKVGRKNRYSILKESKMRHSVNGHCTVGQFLKTFSLEAALPDVELNALNHWRIGEHGSEIKFQIKES